MTSLAALPIDFENLFTHSPNPYVLVDDALQIAWMNNAYLLTTHRSREAILGLPLLEAFPSDPESESYRLLTQSLQRVLDSRATDEIALIRYDIQDREGRMEQRYWSATHTPMLNAEGKVAYILQHTVDVTELQNLRRLRDESGLVQRANAVQARNINLSAETGRLRKLFEQAPGFIAVLEGPNHIFQLTNAAYREIMGGRDLLGMPLAHAVPEAVDQGFVALLDNVLSTGDAYVGRSASFRLAQGEEPGRQRFLDFVYQPIVGEDGAITGVFVQGHDVTEEASLLRRQELLINELNHRVKNNLAIVQGLAAQSFRAIDPAGDARLVFDSRLKALAAAHDMLTERAWEPTSLRQTIERTIAAAAGEDAERVDLEGPMVPLEPQHAVALAMAVHELSTNAIKYGALSNEVGRVRVTWHHDDEGMLVIDWTERGGPRVVVPSRKGFGTRLIERGLSAEVDGRAKIDFPPHGVHCRFTINLPARSS